MTQKHALYYFENKILGIWFVKVKCWHRFHFLLLQLFYHQPTSIGKHRGVKTIRSFWWFTVPPCSFSCVYELCDFKLRSFGIGMSKKIFTKIVEIIPIIFYLLLVFLFGYCYLQNGKLKGNAKMGIWDFLNLLGSRGSFATQKSWIFDYWRHWQVKKNGIVQVHHNSCYIPSTNT